MGNFHDGEGNKCPICGKENIDINCNSINDELYCYECPDCGEFFVPNGRILFNDRAPLKKYNISKLKSYLFSHPSDKRAVFLSSDDYDKYVTDEYVEVYNLTPEMVENWYPKTFAEKIDKILLNLAQRSKYFGYPVHFSSAELSPMLFMKNIYYKGSEENLDTEFELEFLLNYFIKNDYIVGYSEEIDLFSVVERIYDLPNDDEKLDLPSFTLSAKAWDRVYELQKNQTNNQNVFVAMKFGKETQALREKLKEGLEGYNVRIMDEIEHNHQIVPEMLYEIRNSKFVIAELSNHNNGAYYEAGYALGLGKEVIHICQKNELSNGLHFDVAQVNTIVYENIDEIPEKLKKRIQATIK